MFTLTARLTRVECMLETHPYVCRLPGMRRTVALMEVAIAIMSDPSGKHWGYSLMQESGVRSGVLYPILARMLADGWLSDGWENPATTGGRPPRRYYELTEKGKRELGALLQHARSEARFRGLNFGGAQ
jgi:PadR family transcriptional regulator, regulatory protein PadR